MKACKRLILFFFACVALTMPLASAQAKADRAADPEKSSSEAWWERWLSKYEPKPVPALSFDNSSRLGSLVKDKFLYLSLDDAIALALENNLDIELQRVGPEIASYDFARASAGGALRGISLTVNEVPQGVGGPAGPILNLPATGSPFSTSVSTNLAELTSIIPGQSSALITGPIALSAGPAIPVFEPTFSTQLNWQHTTALETTLGVSGFSTLTARSALGNFSLVKGFSSGAQFSIGFNANSQHTNSMRNIYDPYTSSSFSAYLAQPLLRGFGRSVNRRYIVIANNNQKISDLVFKQQLIGTVAGVVRLYFDLVALQEDVQVKRQTLALVQRLYADNKEKEEQGTLAPIELVRSQAQMASSRQDLANSEGFEQQQELVVKNVLSRRGSGDPLIHDLSIKPTTPIDVPLQEVVPQAQELLATAAQKRPELEEGRLQLSNSEISLRGSRSALKPDLNLIVSAQNNGLAGDLNPLALASSPIIDPALMGGFGTTLAQIFRRNYPAYGIGVQLNLPLHNQVAQSDYARDSIQYSQTQIRYQQLQNQVRLEVEAALTALRRSRSAYDAAVEARNLQEQSLKVEMEKYENGISTSFMVMQYQSFLAQARSTEVAAKGVYIKAKTALERAIGMTLDNHNIAVDEALGGKVSRPPSTLP
jgi:outer membrane protein